jgi:DNA-binding transcriptional ArsR family regulator
MTQSRTTDRQRQGRRRGLDDATRLAKAFSHPLRARILSRLNEGVASPNELAGELGEPLGNVSYHVRALLDLGCVELVETAPRRGAVEHYYRATERALCDDDAWAQIPAPVRRGLATEWFKDMFADATEAINAGRVDSRTDSHFTFTPLVLDETAWQELAELLKEVLDRAFELQAEAAARQASGDGENEVFTRLVMAQYEGVSRAKARKRRRGK